MLKGLYKLAILTAVLVTVGCTAVGPVAPSLDQQRLEQAQELARSGDPAGALNIYAELAAASTDGPRASYLTAGARLLIEGDDAGNARQWLDQARAVASPQQLQEIIVLGAGIELAEDRPTLALELLEGLSEPRDSDILLEAAAVEGRALFGMRRPEAAVAILVERELWLNDADAVLANHDLIWEGLGGHPAGLPLVATGDATIDGWLDLQPVAAAYPGDPSGLETRLSAWRDAYPNHPAAATYLSELLERNRLSLVYPDNVALLLPLANLRRQASAAIRDGFIAAHLNATGGDASPHIRIYDTDELGSLEAYARATADGADFIVGPLLKPDVDLIVGSAGIVPTLALNFAQPQASPPPGFFQFALAPEDEAIEVARHAAANGAVNAVALIPDNDWGIRLLNSFRTEFEQLGGELLQFRGYDPDGQDFSLTITTLLNLTHSTQRYQRLAANLGVPVEFEPRRRQDVDVIFVATNARNGRLLAPQLRFHYAGDIPTYATSEIYGPTTAAGDADLDGILFPDTPWLLAPNAESREIRATLENYWPQRAAQWPRLFAMGFDAYRLIPLLYNRRGGFTSVPAMSGELSIDAGGRIHRRLPFAQFRNGEPVALEREDTSLSPRSAELVGLR